MPRDPKPTSDSPTSSVPITDARIGDSIVARSPGGAPRRGVIIATFGSDRNPHFEVLWSDARQSLFYPDERRTEVIPRHRPSRRRGSIDEGDGD